jgi:hypothetical protein
VYPLHQGIAHHKFTTDRLREQQSCLSPQLSISFSPTPTNDILLHHQEICIAGLERLIAE